MEDTATLKAQVYAPELPWNQQDLDQLGPTIMKYMEDHEPFFKRWSEIWFNNFQFLYGNQAVRWSRRYGYAVDVDFLQRLPAMNQRSQTNIARVVAEALASLIYANLPEWVVEAAEESSIKGKRYKRIVQKLLDAYMVRQCMDVELSNAAMIYTVTGMVGAQIDWNPLGGQLLSVPKWNKSRQPAFTTYMAPNPITDGLLEVPVQELDQYGQPAFEDRWEPVLDEMGQQVIDKFFAGDLRIETLTPFEYRRAVGSPGMHKTKYTQRIRMLDYDEFLDMYGNMPGRTKFYDKVQPVYNNPAIYRLAVRHFMRMQFTTPPGLNELYNRPENVYRSGLFRSKVLVVEHYDAPHPVKWPLGRKVIVCNGDVTHITVPTYSTNKMDGWHPFVEAQWMNVQPSSMGIGPMNDVIAKNRELNIADSLISTALRRNMGSQLLIKTGSGVDPQRFTGEPGMIHEVPDPFGMRWLHDDMPLPTVLPALRQNYKDDCYETSGAGDALRGDRSPGAPSGYAQRIIQEREEKRLTPARKRFEKFVAGIGEKAFSCLKHNVIKLDESVMGYLMRSASGEFQPQDVISLLSAPIDYGIEINVEADSMHLRSKATEQATVQEMAQNPAVAQRLQGSAKCLDEYLKFFDAEVLRDDSARHRDRAQRENEQFMDLLRLGPQALQTGSPIVLLEDDDDIHLNDHTDFLLQNSDEIMRNEAFLLYFLQHTNRHRLQKQEKAGDLMPGTSLQVPNMQSSAEKAAVPTVQTIYQKAQMDNMAAAAAPQAPLGPQSSAAPVGPQGPKSPAPIGSKGPPQTNVSTPAANTPSGAKQGPTP